MMLFLIVAYTVVGVSWAAFINCIMIARPDRPLWHRMLAHTVASLAAFFMWPIHLVMFLVLFARWWHTR